MRSWKSDSPSLASYLAEARRRKRARRTHVHLCFYPHDCRSVDRASSRRLRKRGITTSWDFGWNEPLTNDRGLTDLIDALDFVFVNELEARLYTGEPTLEASIPALARAQGDHHHQAGRSRAPSGSRPIATSTSPRRA